MTDQEIEKLSKAIVEKLAKLLRQGDEQVFVRNEPVNVKELLDSRPGTLHLPRPRKTP